MGGSRVAKALAVALFLCALSAALLVPRTVALADDSSVGAVGGSVHAIWTTNVRMAAETVQAVCFDHFAEYRVDFKFVNEGKARKIKLGFPFTDTVGGEEGTEPPVGFQAWQNGRPLTVRAVAARATKSTTVGYFVHEAVFPHGATMITVSYLAGQGGVGEERRRRASVGHPGSGGLYQYWLHSGSTWKGPIGKAVVRYRLADSFRGSDIELAAADASRYAPLTSPPNWTRPLPRTYQWQFSDFEPKATPTSDWWKPQSPFDITLAFTNPGSRPSTHHGSWTWSSVAQGFGDKEDDNLQGGGLTDCWAEGVPGPGIGQWVQARFKRSVRLRELRILPGNNAYESAFRRFARPRTLTAIFSDGSSTLLHLKDSPTLQRFPVHVTTRSVRLVIRSVYLGTDYPATCISEVEFGTERAPGYAPFTQLIADPSATGRLTAWAGPPAPAPRSPVDTGGWGALQDYESSAGGDLIGISDWTTYDASFPADAPFKEPASLATIRAKAPAVRLPDPRLVGAPTTISALSYRTYEIRYSSGMDLLVNTRLTGWPQTSLAAELAAETENMDSYTDGRKHPFELATIGHQTVGLAQPGGVSAADSDIGDEAIVVPGQVFWRAGTVAYHLYAPSNAATSDGIVNVARAMIEPLPVSVARPGSSSWRWWFAPGAALVAAIVTVAVLGLRRQKALALPPEMP